MNEIMVNENKQEMNIVDDLTSANAAFCSMSMDTPEQKLLVFKAMNTPDFRIGDCINTTIKVKDIYCEIVDCKNEETGETSKAPRVVLIDDEGKSYQSVSVGIYGAVKKLMQVFGVPTWEQPIPLKIVQVTKGKNKMLTLDIAR